MADGLRLADLSRGLFTRLMIETDTKLLCISHISTSLGSNFVASFFSARGRKCGSKMLG